MRNPFERALFWTTFVAVWFDTSRAWGQFMTHIALHHVGITEFAHLSVLVLATLHLWWGGRDHG